MNLENFDFFKITENTVFSNFLTILRNVLKNSVALKVVSGDLGEKGGGGYIGSKLDVWS